MAMSGFICHDDYLQKTAKLSDEEIGRLFRALMRYHATGVADEVDGRESIAFDFIREDIDRTEAAYKAKCEKNRNNRLSVLSNDRQQSSTTDNDRQQSSTTDNDRDQKEKEKEKEKEEEKEKKKDNRRFTPPSVDEVRSYCQSRNEGRGNGIDPEHFVDYYQARGWVLSNGKKMQDWKACVRTWEERRKNGPGTASGGGKGVIAQQYEQRAYTGPQRSADDVLDYAEKMMNGAIG